MPLRFSITLYIFLMLMMIGCWHYAVDIWDNWIKPIAHIIRKPVSKPASRVDHLIPQYRASPNSYTLDEEGEEIVTSSPHRKPPVHSM
jgi:hypothetical protein